MLTGVFFPHHVLRLGRFFFERDNNMQRSSIIRLVQYHRTAVMIITRVLCRSQVRPGLEGTNPVSETPRSRGNISACNVNCLENVQRTWTRLPCHVYKPQMVSGPKPRRQADVCPHVCMRTLRFVVLLQQRMYICLPWCCNDRSCIKGPKCLCFIIFTI